MKGIFHIHENELHARIRHCLAVRKNYSDSSVQKCNQYKLTKKLHSTFWTKIVSKDKYSKCKVRMSPVFFFSSNCTFQLFYMLGINIPTGNYCIHYLWLH